MKNNSGAPHDPTSARSIAPASPAIAYGCGGLQQRGPNSTAMRIPKVFTIGYEDKTPDSLIECLREAGVQRVVDVRELPLSRRYGFSKSALAAALARAGIRYEHMRELGNPKLYRNQYKAGDVEGGSRAFRSHLHNG